MWIQQKANRTADHFELTWVGKIKLVQSNGLFFAGRLYCSAFKPQSLYLLYLDVLYFTLELHV